DAAQADLRRGDDAAFDVEGERDRDAGDVVEASLGDLVEGGHLRERQRDAHGANQLIRTAHRLAVAGEVVGQVDFALAVDGCQHQARTESEQRGRAVADGRAGSEVATERGAVADQARGELGDQLRQQRYVCAETSLDL